MNEFVNLSLHKYLAVFINIIQFVTTINIVGVNTRVYVMYHSCAHQLGFRLHLYIIRSLTAWYETQKHTEFTESTNVTYTIIETATDEWLNVNTITNTKTRTKSVNNLLTNGTNTIGIYGNKK